MGVNFTQSQLDRSAAGKMNVHTVVCAPQLKRFQTYCFQIQPIPAIRPTRAQMKLIHMDPNRLNKSGQATRQRIIRAEMYKQQLHILATAQNFFLPESNFQLVFFLPMPQSWSIKKKAEMSGKPHKSKPDWDNLAKLFQDALKSSDASIWDCRVQKFWCPEANARIEVSYQP